MKGEYALAAGAVFLALAVGTFVGVVPGFSTGSVNPYYSVCNVTSATGNLIVTNCSGSFFLAGIPGSQQYYFVFTVSVAGPCSSVASPSGYTWVWSPTPNGPGSGSVASYVFSAWGTSSLQATFTVTNGPGSAAGTITIYPVAGTSSQTGTATALPTPCPVTTTSSSTSMTNTGGPSLPPNYPISGLALAIAGISFLGIALYELKEDEEA